MTKIARVLGISLVALLSLATIAAAHGGSEPRSIDTRLLADDDGFFAYDYGAQVGLATAGGHDLVTLDVHEAYDADGAPALHFRLVWQTDATEPVQDTLVFTAAGSEHRFDLISSTTSLDSHTFDGAMGPTSIGDGHPKAFDLIVRYDTVGVSAGDELTGIQIIGYGADGDAADVAPGTWMTATGELAPYVGESTTEAEPASYTLQGPAAYLAGSEVAVQTFEETTTFPIEITNLLADFDQTLTFTATGPDGLTIEAPRDLFLEAGSTTTFNVTFKAQGLDANVTLDLHSDLGGHLQWMVPVQATGAAVHDTATDASEAGSDPGMDQSDHAMDHTGHEDEDTATLDEESPGVGLVAILVGLAALVIVRRR